MREQNEMEVSKSSKLSAIEVERFQNMVAAIGSDTLRAMANAGPEMQARLLQGLGIQSTLITDGTSPINLFQTAQGLIGGGPMPMAKKQRRRAPHDSDDEDDQSSQA